MNLTAWIGLAVMVISEAATLARIEPFWSWNTPIAWTGFILFADGIVWRARGDSWLRSNGREFVVLALVSIPLWLVFEGYNQILRNWFYVGLPENFALRMFGYGWSFATIWPALFEGAELVAITRAGWAGRAGRAGTAAVTPVVTPVVSAPRLVARGVPSLSRDGFSRTVMAVGVIMLVSPFLVPSDVALYMAAPVFLGFIFLLDPLNARLGGESLLADL